MNLIRKLAVVVVAMGSASIAQADPITITVLIGDKDCFGRGGVCFDGDIAVVGQEDNRDPGDPLGTDQSGVNFELGGPSFDFGLDLGGATPLSASLTTFTAGIGFEGTTGGSGIGATFYFNGTEIGYYFEAPGFQNRAATIVFDVPILLLADLNNITVFHPDIGNDVAVIRKIFAIDYLELTIEADDCEPFPGGGATGGCFPGPGPFPAPEPGTLALLSLGLLGLGLSRRGRRLE